MNDAANGPRPIGSGRGPQRTRVLRVALITNGYTYIEDGIALTVHRLVEYLEGRGVEVLVFAPTSNTAILADAAIVVSTPSMRAPLRPEYRVTFGLSRRARRRLDAFRPDIIHITVPDLLGYQALAFGVRNNIPVVTSYHTRYEAYLKYYNLEILTPILKRYLNFFYNSCRQVYVPSESMMDILKEQHVGKEVCLWRRGVDTHRFNPDRGSPAWRRAQGIGETDIVVAFVARLVREKALGILAATLRELQDRGVQFRSIVVGDGPERSALEAQLPESIFTGFLRGAELAQAYASADIFLFPSDTETFGSVTLEAMASGLPTVCADASGSRSLVVSGTTGFLAPPGDVQGFVQSVAALVQDGAMRQRMGVAARRRSLDFSWEAEMARLFGYYRSVLNPSSAVELEASDDDSTSL
jgi:phosphatidylinositol alpha 1,6-mannosyltransferase